MLSDQSLVPEEATLVIDARFADVFSSPVAASVAGVLSGDDEDGEGFFSDFERDIGISLSSIEYAEMFMDVEAALDSGPTLQEGENTTGPSRGAALHGPFDMEEQIANFGASVDSESGVPHEVESYRGFDIYFDPSGGPDSLVLSFFDSDTMLLGTADGVRAMLDVASGVGRPFSGEAVQVLTGLGERDLGVIIIVDPELMLEMSGETGEQMGPLGALNPNALTAPLTVASFRFEGNAMEVRTRQVFDDEDTATASKEYTEGTTAMLGAMIGSPELQEVLSGMEIAQDGRDVTQSLSIDTKQMEKILEFLLGLMAVGTPEPQG